MDIKISNLIDKYNFRYDDDTINQRKIGILNFLEYIGRHSVLFTSPVCVKFFEVNK